MMKTILCHGVALGLAISFTRTDIDTTICPPPPSVAEWSFGLASNCLALEGLGAGLQVLRISAIVCNVGGTFDSQPHVLLAQVCASTIHRPHVPLNVFYILC